MDVSAEYLARRQPAAGEIWMLRAGGDDLILVSSVFLPSRLDSPTTIVVVPIARGDGLEGMVSEHDVFIRPRDSSIRSGMVAECWNARLASVECLSARVGTVNRGALWAVQAILNGLRARCAEVETSAEDVEAAVAPVAQRRERFRVREQRRWEQIFEVCDLHERGGVRSSRSAIEARAPFATPGQELPARPG